MKDKNTASIPVLIAGGGPSGSATALSLQARGIPCIVVDAPYPHAFKPGETLPANAQPLLRKLGIAQLLTEPEHLPCYGNRYVWGSETPSDQDFMQRLHNQGWHLDRLLFEQQLQQTCIDRGITWHKGRITDCAPQGDHRLVTIRHHNQTETQVLCRFVVDATGRPSRIARSMSAERRVLDHLAGICTRVMPAQPVELQYTFIEACANGWWYAAPMPDHSLALAFMTDSDLLDNQLLQRKYLLQQAAGTHLLKDLLHDATPTSYQVLTQTASTSLLTQRFGRNWLAVGDAAYAYDPVSSYGIVSSLEGGYYAGHAIADTLHGVPDALEAYDWIITQAFEVYRQMHRQQYAYEQRFGEHAFWERRAIFINQVSPLQ
jgi:2-polyprenyl-6-methoxyphenol hydroxylase-like FAD-dependent oxidoreductase